MREYRPTFIVKVFSWLLLVMLVLGAALNVYHHNVTHPYAFLVVIVGFLLFAAGKLSVITNKKKISFGTKLMTENMANVYRVGYWLMVVGLLATFAPQNM